MENVIFDNNTDYEGVEYYVKDKFSYIATKNECCNAETQPLYFVSNLLLAADIAKQYGNVSRYQNSIQTAYYYINS